MKKSHVTLLVALGLAGLVLTVGCSQQAADDTAARTAAAPAAAPDPVERGKYLVTVMGCHDCHTPLMMGPNGPEPDMSRMLSGHPASMPLPEPPKLGEGPWGWTGTLTLTAFAGPWGTSYAANLTPHESGLGVWSESMFLQALRTGKHMGTGRPILPPMPWMWAGQSTDEDLKAIFAYLQTVPPIENVVPDAVVAGPGH